MVRDESDAAAARNFVARRFAAFLIDLAFAAVIVTLIPAILVEASLGRLRVASLPGFTLTYCHPEDSTSVSLGAIVERMQKSPPPGTRYYRTQSCTMFVNLIFRNQFTQVEFSSGFASFAYYRIPTDHFGEAIEPLFVNVPSMYFELLFAVVFLLAALLDSPGMRIMRIRVRSRSGARLGYLEFIIRSVILCFVIAPVWFLPSDLKIFGLAATAALAAILLVPWLKTTAQGRRGLHDLLTEAVVVRVPVGSVDARPRTAPMRRPQSPG